MANKLELKTDIVEVINTLYNTKTNIPSQLNEVKQTFKSVYNNINNQLGKTLNDFDETVHDFTGLSEYLNKDNTTVKVLITLKELILEQLCAGLKNIIQDTFDIKCLCGDKYDITEDSRFQHFNMRTLNSIYNLFVFLCNEYIRTNTNLIIYCDWKDKKNHTGHKNYHKCNMDGCNNYIPGNKDYCDDCIVTDKVYQRYESIVDFCVDKLKVLLKNVQNNLNNLIFDKLYNTEQYKREDNSIKFAKEKLRNAQKINNIRESLAKHIVNKYLEKNSYVHFDQNNFNKLMAACVNCFTDVDDNYLYTGSLKSYDIIFKNWVTKFDSKADFYWFIETLYSFVYKNGQGKGEFLLNMFLTNTACCNKGDLNISINNITKKIEIKNASDNEEGRLCYNRKHHLSDDPNKYIATCNKAINDFISRNKLSFNINDYINKRCTNNNIHELYTWNKVDSQNSSLYNHIYEWLKENGRVDLIKDFALTTLKIAYPKFDESNFNYFECRTLENEDNLKLFFIINYLKYYFEIEAVDDDLYAIGFTNNKNIFCIPAESISDESLRSGSVDISELKERFAYLTPIHPDSGLTKSTGKGHDRNKNFAPGFSININK